MTSQHLFVYGTLRPGEPNAHLLERIGGTFRKAYVHGHFDSEGWGKTGGYPAIKLDPAGPRIDGYVFSSEHLDAHWTYLDDFEGDAYERRRVDAVLDAGETIRAFVYTIANTLI